MTGLGLGLVGAAVVFLLGSAHWLGQCGVTTCCVVTVTASALLLVMMLEIFGERRKQRSGW